MVAALLVVSVSISHSLTYPRFVFVCIFGCFVFHSNYFYFISILLLFLLRTHFEYWMFIVGHHLFEWDGVWGDWCDHPAFNASILLKAFNSNILSCQFRKRWIKKRNDTLEENWTNEQWKMRDQVEKEWTARGLFSFES